MSITRIIQVDAQGKPLDGSDLIFANKHAVDAGFMANRPVVLRYPCGKTVRAFEARLTQKGLAEIARQMGRQIGVHNDPVCPSRPPLWRQMQIFAACLALILAFGAAALGALLAPQRDWAGLWGDLSDFAAPTAAQARAEGWAALSERV